MPQANWRPIARRILDRILKKAQAEPGLRRVGPKTFPWDAQLQLVSAPAMTELNGLYRKKPYPTDVLSFTAPPVFFKQGVLGELVICLPVLKRQAKELGHSPRLELEVLLVHGVLHLLGFDHEKGKRDARAMARWERKLLGEKAARAALIERAQPC